MNEQRFNLDDTINLVPPVENYPGIAGVAPSPDRHLAQNLDHDGLSLWMLEHVGTDDNRVAITGTAPSPFDIFAQPSADAVSWIQAHNQTTIGPAKVGNRLSLESARVLRQWFTAHEEHPYATAQDVQVLQSRTGLSKRQVTTWLANARRRSPIRSPSLLGQRRPATISASSAPVGIPSRRATPMPFEQMNPLERWESSPPEHEAATVADISRWVAASSASPSTPYYSRASEMSSSDASSVSSAGISHSSRDSVSGSSAFSYNSTISLRALNTNRRRRRKTVRRQTTGQPGLLQTCHRYQCTFCIETFKHKYDWQRHEKSLHLSLEEWLCSPTGATVLDPATGEVLCVYCGEADPEEAHLHGHNHRVCQERAPKERTFYRKDHLRQHLKLVHESSFREWPMDDWKVASREIESRCGFCSIPLATWADRADHLAEHFKSGSTMADWKGGWGFHPQVIDTIENAMPPYLIHYERSSPLPISAMSGPADTPTSAYELIKLELEHFTREHLDTHGWLPSDVELQHEGCSIIFGADIVSPDPASPAPSWLRDLFVCSEVSKVARLRPMQQIAKSRLSQLKINGKGSIFDNCELENDLFRFVAMHRTLSLELSDNELQQEASNILGHMEAFLPDPSKHFVDFLGRLVWGSTKWLELFRQRAQLGTSDVENESSRGPNIDSVEPVTENTDSDATHSQLRSLQGDISSMPDLGNWLLCSPGIPGRAAEVPYPELPNNQQDTTDVLALPSSRQGPVVTSALVSHGGSSRGGKPPNGIPFLLNDHNSYRRLAAGLSRFVASAISPNNPNSHVPTDEELQYQARWMWYDDDDPWNQTPADNVEWLREFKRDVGVLNEDS